MSLLDSTPAVRDVIDARLHLDTPYWSSAGIISEIGTLCDRAEDAVTPGAVVLELVGPEVTGQPVTGWGGELSVTLVNKWERAVRRFERLGAPTITVVSGECSGPSLDLLLASDYRIGAPTVRLGLARSAGTLWPGMALHRLVQQLGVAAARRMALFGHHLGAHEAHELGLLDEVTEDAAVAAGTVAAHAGELTGFELAVRRGLLLDAVFSSHEDAVGAHLSAVDRTLRQGRPEQDLAR